jgi:hypothetical protein
MPFLGVTMTPPLDDDIDQSSGSHPRTASA